MLETVVNSRAGKVGGVEKDGVLQFRGVPFAAPPTGARRFRAPAPVEPWEGVRPCTAFASSAAQPIGSMEALLGASRIPSSEDCLYLNVFTPAADDRGRPVMVWIHGGGFQSGSGAVPWYHGARLARAGDVVVVTINYRLGVLGFLRLDHLLGGDLAASANAGLLDQIAALEWVRDNIDGFGGDPARVTIFGESAGGMSVATLLATPSARGLFGRAVAQSGAGHNTMNADAAAGITSAVLDRLGVGDSGAERLLDMSVDALVDAQAAVGTAERTLSIDERRRGLGLPFQPVVDGKVVPQRAVDAVAAGSAAGVALVAGTTLDEWNLFSVIGGDRSLDDETLRRRAGRVFGDDADDVIDAYEQSRPGASPAALFSAIMTDLVFRQPAIRLLEAHEPHGPAWSYLWSWGSTAFEGALGACHAVEIPFVFDNLDRKGVPFFLGEVDDAARALATATSRAWLAFATNGDPNHGALPEWPAYDTDRRATMNFSTAPAVVDDPHGDIRRRWAGVI
jgi:para-nitrobenzyl esterase